MVEAACHWDCLAELVSVVPFTEASATGRLRELGRPAGLICTARWIEVTPTPRPVQRAVPALVECTANRDPGGAPSLERTFAVNIVSLSLAKLSCVSCP